ncbi:MAG TPA: flagellar hook-basal body protein [Candidatus Hydrogenedentes bacterium]|nr:flagellar hook-basal body protein [Candidatus Hydrogenedentota bacterium]HPG66636.1 flagellar hook-basal body protein [Candidatus Hydrogenedentota bacterium]
MIQGLYAAATGLLAVEARQDVTANNIANASTAGFKAQRPVQEGFQAAFATALRRPGHFDRKVGPGGGTRLAGTYGDFVEGIIQQTGNPLDVALDGPGYLVVDTVQGERFTRAGHLTADVDGHLATPDGHKVQSVDGAPIDVRGGRVTIGEDGHVRVGGIEAGRIRVVEFENPHELTREGNTLYVASDDVLRRSAAAEDTRVHQESLEMSNVNLPREMIEMTLGLRAYAANQRVINAIDETMSRLIDQVGSPV